MRGGSQIGYQNPQEFDNISIARGFKGDSLWDEIWELLLRCLHFSVLFYFFIEKQQELEVFSCPRRRFECYCCLTILIYTFKCFKTATNPRYTYVLRVKGIRLQE